MIIQKDDSVNLLFHYTTLESAQNILTSQTFHLTDINQVNDLTEHKHYKEAIESVIESNKSCPEFDKIIKTQRRN